MPQPDQAGDVQPPLIAVVGATATGKTGLAIALAQALGGEVIGADSRQVYRGMAIGTAQPTAGQLASAPHHLIAIINPDAGFGLATYLDLANAAIRETRARGRVPIVAGGAGQYVHALLEEWTVPRVAPDPALRAELEELARTFGNRALHQRLGRVDAAAAAAIHPNNVRRVIRALEVYERTGRAISAQQERGSRGRPIVVGLALQRDALYARIDARVESMYAAGLLDEVAGLEAAGYRRDLPSMASIGYPEAWSARAREVAVADAIRLTQLATHRLARQQQNWFRPDDARIAWLDASSPTAAERAVETVRGLLAERAGEAED